jgi:hypothetical protein
MSSTTTAAAAAIMAIVFLLLRMFILCPRELSHIPRIPLVATVISFLSGETESARTLRLHLPLAKQNRSGIVIIWALGEWYVHVLDYKVSQ